MTPKQQRTIHFNMNLTSFDVALKYQDSLNAALDSAGSALDKYAKGGTFGLTPDHIKATPQWQADRLAFDTSMRNLREFNTVFLRNYKKEYRKHIQAKRGY